jgi:hypothetical protein
MWNIDLIQIQQHYEKQVTYERGRIKEGTLYIRMNMEFLNLLKPL